MKWFKHYANASDDDFIEWLEGEYGLEGYARWWKILETIAKSMDKSGEPCAVHSWNKWQTLLVGKRSKLLTYLLAIQSRGKMKLEYNENVLKITCPKMLKMKDEYSRKSGHAPDKCPDNVAQEAEQETETEKQLSRQGGFSEVYEFGSKLFPTLATANSSAIHAWLNAGCSVDLDIKPELLRIHGRGQSIRGWSYFTGGIMDAKATRDRPPDAGTARIGAKTKPKITATTL